MRIYACYSLKGGVGKTASAVNLAHLASVAGQRTLLLDLDPQGAASFTFRIQPRIEGGYSALLDDGVTEGEILAHVRGTDFEGLDLFPADYTSRLIDRFLEANGSPRVDPIERLLDAFVGEYDRVFVDCPPTASRLADGLFAACDHLLVPTIPTTLALRTLAQLMKHLKKIDPRPQALPFFSLVDRRKALHRHIVEWERATGLGFLETTIPYSTVLEQMSTRRAPVFDYAARSAPAESYRRLWAEVEERVARHEAGEKSTFTKKKKRRAVESLVRDARFVGRKP